MTGYAKEQCTIGNRKICIEIKTLNSKQLDTNVKLPSTYRAFDLAIRSLLNRLERGKIDFILTEEAETNNVADLNRELVAKRYHEIVALQEEMGATIPPQQILQCIINQSAVWENATADEPDEAMWAELSKCVSRAIGQVDQVRSHEGNILQQDFEKHVALIEQKLQEIPQYEAERIDTAKERIRKYFDEMNIKDANENRFEQEIIYYLEKLDITEEKVRLAKHIDYFRHTMLHEEGSGKKLGFIAQEMGREINTTGSKANHVEIQKIVVQMKDELEKIKEQLGNIL